MSKNITRMESWQRQITSPSMYFVNHNASLIHWQRTLGFKILRRISVSGRPTIYRHFDRSASFTCRGQSLGFCPSVRPGRGQRPGRPSGVRTSGRARFCDRAENLEEHAPDRGRGVDALVEYDQVDLVLLQILGQSDQVLHGAAEPIQAPAGPAAVGSGVAGRPRAHKEIGESPSGFAVRITPLPAVISVERRGLEP
jgi:hypothetical protein